MSEAGLPPGLCCADCAVMKARIEQMCTAYAQLSMGGAIRVFVDSDGSRIEYTSANSTKLKGDLQLLQAYYAAYCAAGATGGPAVMTRPLNFIF